MLTVDALAKLNLTLEVLGKRPDGFHEIRSILQAIDLCDTLHFRLADEISFRCDMKGWAAEKSLVSRAASLLREYVGFTRGAGIRIEKRIPLISGLGGDSSDAAAVLRGLNELWQLGKSRQELMVLAAQLGSDVSFFLHGGTVLAEGRGEKVTPLPPVTKVWVVLVVPDIPAISGKTARMYQSLSVSHCTDGRITESLLNVIKSRGKFNESYLFNTFENIASKVYPGLDVYKDHIIKLGAPRVHLAGSGPALFIIFRDKNRAEDLFTQCKQQGMKSYLAAAL